MPQGGDTGIGCENHKILYEHLMAAIEDSARDYSALMQRVLTSASLLSLTLGVLVGQHANLLRGALTSWNPFLFLLGFSIVAAIAVFMLAFWRAAAPKKSRPVYEPEEVKKGDYHKSPCELYGQLVPDMADTLKKSEELNGSLGRWLSWLVGSALVALALLGILIVYAG